MGSHYHCVQPQNAFEATKSHFGERYLRRCERMSRNAAPGRLHPNHNLTVDTFARGNLAMVFLRLSKHVKNFAANGGKALIGKKVLRFHLFARVEDIGLNIAATKFEYNRSTILALRCWSVTKPVSSRNIRW